MLCNDNDVAYLKALLLSELNTQEHNYATTFRDTIRAVFFIVIHCHVVKVNTHAKRLHTHMVWYSDTESEIERGVRGA